MLNKLVLIISLFAIACAKAPPAIPFDKKFNQLEVGQTAEQVTALLGAPDLREVKDGKEIWHYKLDDPRDVEFKDKKIVSFFRGTPIVTTGPVVQTIGLPPRDRAIGTECKDNKECQSLNCHFNVCSGSNNCFKKVGDLCSNDQECCGGYCDFAVCKKKH